MSDTITTPVGEADDRTQPSGLSPLPLLALSLGYFLVMLDVTVVTVAAPTVQDSLHVDASGLQWIVDGYSTVFAGLLLLGGGLGDRLGHRRIFVTGLVIFMVASLCCGVATTAGVLVAGRLLQGVGAAFLVPTSLALLRVAYPDRASRARAFGIWAGVSAVAFAAGPVVGGLLVWGLNWSAVFWLNIPITIVAMILTLRFVPAPSGGTGGGRMDPAGQVLGVVGLLALAGALNQAGSAGWGSRTVVGAFVLGALALLAFLIVERRLEAGHRVDVTRRAPLLAPSLFGHLGFAATAAIGVLLNLGYYGMLYLSTLYLQQARGYDVLGAGLALLPSVCMALVAAPLSGRVTARVGPFLPMTLALFLGAAGFLGWLFAGPHTPYWYVVFALVATGIATPTTVPAATAAIMETAPAEAAGVASAVFNIARQIGNAVGVALFGTIAAVAGNLVTGVHIAAVIAAVAFTIGALLALLAGRAAKAGAPA